MPSSLEHLWTFSQTACGLLAPHTISNVLLRSPSEQRKAAKAAEAGRGTNVWSIAGAPERGAMRSLFIHVCERKIMATGMRLSDP